MSRPRGRGWGRPPVHNRRNDRLANLDPREFERVVAGYYQRQGYAVEHCGTGAGRSRFDGGIDLKMYRDGKYTIVQCKRENARQVTHNVGHELLGLLLTERADHAIVVNAGEFTPHARACAAKDSRLQLIDGDRLREMLPEYAVPQTSAGREAPGRAPLDWPLSGHSPAPARGSVRGSGVRNGRSQDGTKALVALAFLIALVLWQCTFRSAPKQQVERFPAQPLQQDGMVRAPRPPSQVSRQSTSVPIPERSRPKEARDAERRADAAIKILEDTTPELLLPPDPHAVYQE